MPAMPGIHFDPYAPDFVEDPYPTYRRLRAETPVAYEPEWDLTFFARHEDVWGILRDKRFGRDALHRLDESQLSRPAMPREYPLWCRMIRGSFIDIEPPEHTRLRGLVAKAFSRRSSESYRRRLEVTADRLLDVALADGGMEAISRYAIPIPLEMISDLMGIEESDRPSLLEWSHAIVKLFDYNATQEDGAAAEAATADFVEYLRPIISRRRTHPGDDLVSAMLQVDDDGDTLDEDDIVATSILTLNAGHEATVHAIGNGMLALARSPEQYRALRADPGLAKLAVDELLRFDTPLQMFERWVLEDLEWNGHHLEAGTKVGLLFGSANRDPGRFREPEVLDLSRPDVRHHVSFGGGTHYCVGAPLAKVELEVAFRALAERVPSLVVDEAADFDRLESLVFRGVNRLPVSF